MLPLGLDLLSRAARAVPPVLDPPLARAAGTLWCALDRRRRSAVRANRAALGAHFPVERPFGSSVEALLNWLRLVRANAAEIRARTTFVGLEGDDGVRATCALRGGVLLAAHVGFWEWGAAAIAAAGVPVVAVAGTQMNPTWSPALAFAKRRLGVHVVGPDTSARALVTEMRRGALVALLVDGDVATARARQLVARREIELPRGPGFLAVHRRTTIFGGRCERDSSPGAGRFVVRLERLFDAEHALSNAEEPANASVAAWLERTIAEDPGRWCIFREFFPSDTRAASEARARHEASTPRAARAPGTAPAEPA